MDTSYLCYRLSCVTIFGPNLCFSGILAILEELKKRGREMMLKSKDKFPKLATYTQEGNTEHTLQIHFNLVFLLMMENYKY